MGQKTLILAVWLQTLVQSETIARGRQNKVRGVVNQLGPSRPVAYYRHVKLAEMKAGAVGRIYI